MAIVVVVGSGLWLLATTTTKSLEGEAIWSRWESRMKKSGQNETVMRWHAGVTSRH